MELSHHLNSIRETGTFGIQVQSLKTHHFQVITPVGGAKKLLGSVFLHAHIWLEAGLNCL